MSWVSLSNDYEPQGRESRGHGHFNFAPAVLLLGSVAVVLLTVWYLVF